MNDLIRRLSEIRSQYNCFDEAERPYYHALSEAIEVLSGGVNGDTISRQAAIDLVKFECGEWTGLAKTIGNRINELPSAQPDEKLRKIADLVEGSIDHFDRDDAMDLLYQIKEIVGNETSNIRG